MNDCNRYGSDSVDVVLVHGGPGARGSLEDLALLLSTKLSVLEINQTKYTIEALIEEMDYYISNNCDGEVALLGHSWGAWLICLYSHYYPEKVRRLILVGSGPFEAHYAAEYHQGRLSRMDEDSRIHYDRLMIDFMSEIHENKNEIMVEFGQLMETLDTYESYDNPRPTVSDADFLMFNSIWSEAADMRESGKLIAVIKKLTMPIHVIQGDYDSHNIKGITEVFDKSAVKYSYKVLNKCGHYPWREKYGREAFIEQVLNIINRRH